MLSQSNLSHWQAGKKGFYEVWYFKLNQTQGGPAIWFRLTLLANRAGDKCVAETWAVFFDAQAWGAGHVAVKESFPLDIFVATPEKIQIGDCYWADHKTAGKISSGGHEIRWELDYIPNQGTFDPVPTVLKKLGLSKSVACTPNPNLTFTGCFWVDGKAYSCNASRGMQGHIYGSRQAHGWAWAHANTTGRTPFVIEALTAQVKLGGFLKSPKLSALFFEFEGQQYVWNTLGDALAIQSRYTLDGWEFCAKKPDLKLTGKISGRVGDFAGVQYEDTDGSLLYCHNSKVADLELTACRSDGSQVTLQSNGACAFEVVSRKKDDRVRILI